MSSIESAIQWFEARKGNVTYSMVNRRGPSSYDCSSSVYYALIQGGFLPVGIYIGNTDSLYGDLERNGWVQVQPDSNGVINTQRGDVFIWGVRGQSTGGAGHTGMFENANDIIHCSYGYNGIHIDNHDWLNRINGYPNLTVYRFAGSTPSFSDNPVDQQVEVGSTIKFDKAYRADEVQNVGVWQVHTNELCHSNFTWDDNGIPTSIVTEVDAQGFATNDQELDVGSTYIIPGKFTVLDVGQDGDRWLAQIDASGLKFWVDVETATEIKASDSGTPNPPQRPIPVVLPEQSTPVVNTPTPEKLPDAPVTIPTPVSDMPKPSYAPSFSLRDLLAKIKEVVINWLKEWKK